MSEVSALANSGEEPGTLTYTLTRNLKSQSDTNVEMNSKLIVDSLNLHFYLPQIPTNSTSTKFTYVSIAFGLEAWIRFSFGERTECMAMFQDGVAGFRAHVQSKTFQGVMARKDELTDAFEAEFASEV